ncbi:alpha/beta hydrolase [Streptomyces iconiensis]|uniref:Alpha/beta hydrolase n=1 Tax=Streptomyces iconiensis TaxID=1384038 RepID=A0ABT7A7K0_9ACTN|nr:alpha/beta hydrolase [Streptomyces iconiensis]MDJ1137302.1 alpha/beta hydrolase [Streptomyces iconiensis]
MSIPAVDPEIQSLLDTSDAEVFPLHDLDDVLADPERYRLLREHPATPVDDRVKVEDLFIPGPGGQLRLRVYRPTAEETLPVVLYLHGGAFTYGSPEAEEDHALLYAVEARTVVVSVDYRLAPEHPFPAAPDDAYAALTWLAAHAAEIGGDPERIALMGVSAGGNIAASTAQRARDLGGPKVAFQLLTYPVTDSHQASASLREATDTPVLNQTAAAWAWHYYTGGDNHTPYASPLQATDLSGLPPALVVVAEVDPLRDEGRQYAERLSAAGVTTELIQVPGAVHGFDLIFPTTRVSERNLADQVRALRDALHG